MTKFTNDEKTHAVTNIKNFKRFGYISDQVYEVELATSEIKHKKPIIVGFFILQYAKLRFLGLCYNFFTEFCDTGKREGMEMDIDSVYLALLENELYDSLRSEEKQAWELLAS